MRSGRLMAFRIVRILCVAFVAVILSGGTASANGGASIATAPQ
jgi:hypothetical protein